MKFVKMGSTLFISSVLFMGIAKAEDGERNYSSSCTNEAIAAAEAYDAGSSAYLSCIRVRDDFKIVMAWNNNATNGNILKNTGEKVGQQVVNARNLTRDYTNNYNMTQGDEYKMVIVAYAGGVDWLKTDSDQANIDMVKGLMKQGIKIYACQNTMKSKQLKLADLIEGIEVVPSGVSAVVDFSNRDYTYITP